MLITAPNRLLGDYTILKGFDPRPKSVLVGETMYLNGNRPVLQMALTERAWVAVDDIVIMPSGEARINPWAIAQRIQTPEAPIPIIKHEHGVVIKLNQCPASKWWALERACTWLGDGLQVGFEHKERIFNRLPIRAASNLSTKIEMLFDRWSAAPVNVFEILYVIGWGIIAYLSFDLCFLSFGRPITQTFLLAAGIFAAVGTGGFCIGRYKQDGRLFRNANLLLFLVWILFQVIGWK